jgi:TonB-dependent receptor
VNAGTPEDPNVIYQNLFPDNERDRIFTRLGGFLTSSLQLPNEQQLKMTAFVARRTMDETLFQEATPENGGIINDVPDQFTQLQTQLKYLEDQVAFGQLRGGHPIFEWLNLDWRSAISLSSRNEPDTRYLTYQKQGTGSDPPLFTSDSLGGQRIFNQTQEWLSDSGLDITIPFDTRLPGTDFWSGLPAKFKAGWNYNFRSRTFTQRRFQFVADGATQNLALPAQDLFAPGQIGPGGASANETTLPTDSFDRTEAVLAYYGQLELPIVRDRLRLVGGLREEHSRIQLNTAVARNDVFCADNESYCDVSINLDNDNLLPGVALIYSPRNDMNVRFGFGKTVSRPELRELAPTEFPAARGQLSQFGNPSLMQSTWTSYDLRWEWLPSATDAVSFGTFYKIGQDPIEQTEVNQAGSVAQTWINAEQVKLLGFEFEGRKTMDFISPKLRGLSLQTNVTYFPVAKTNVPTALVAGLPTLQTNTKRGAADVPGFIVNAVAEYTIPDTMTARLLYTTAGQTLLRAGAQGLPDTFGQRYDTLDSTLTFPLNRFFDAPVSLTLSAENITNDQVVVNQGDLVTYRGTRGVTFGISVTYSH